MSETFSANFVFHCTTCDTYTLPPKGFDERIHFVRCEVCRHITYKTMGSPKEMKDLGIKKSPKESSLIGQER